MSSIALDPYPPTSRQAPQDQTFEEFYEASHDHLIAFILARGIKSDCEDIAQKTWMRVWANWDFWEDRGTSREAYLMTVARNLCIDHYRRSHLKDQSLDAIDFLTNEIAPDDPHLTYILDDLFEETDERIAPILAALRTLPIDRQRLMIMWLHGSSFAEIAKRIGSNPNILRTRLFRAQAYIRKQIGKCVNEV